MSKIWLIWFLDKPGTASDGWRDGHESVCNSAFFTCYRNALKIEKNEIKMENQTKKTQTNIYL